MEPVTIMLEVRRGNKSVMRMSIPINGPAGWFSPNPDCDIVTPQGAIREIMVLATVRRPDGSLWRNGIPMDASPSADLPTYELNSQDRDDLLEELPF